MFRDRWDEWGAIRAVVLGAVLEGVARAPWARGGAPRLAVIALEEL